jgi:hypothetical protein
LLKNVSRLSAELFAAEAAKIEHYTVMKNGVNTYQLFHQPTA